MSHNQNKPAAFLSAAAVMLPVAVLAYMLTQHPLNGIAAALLVVVAALVGKAAVRNRPAHQQPTALAPAHNPAAQFPPAFQLPQQDWLPLRSMLDELSRMQTSDDLLERYQCFNNLVAQWLEHAFGPCQISLWCPDEQYQELIECVIMPTHTEKADTLSALTGPSAHRAPCRVPLDSPGIRTALNTGRPYLADVLQLKQQPTDPHGKSIKCDACIPLFREYGLPLLINAEFAPDTPPTNAEQRRRDLKTLAEVIDLAWQQLQSANQRQWSLEHEGPNRILRDEVFLQKAQTLADQAIRQTELFTVVVITLRGFRRMFAGRSQQWQHLVNLIAECITSTLRDQQRTFLLAKTADDVFALMLPDTDEFLARAAMAAVTRTAVRQIPHDPIAQQLETPDLQMVWTLADQRRYQGSIQQMLDEIYARLFCPDQQQHHQSHDIPLTPPTPQENHPCK